MAQTITPDLTANLLSKLQVGRRKHRGEIEIDYVIPGFTEIEEARDILAAFGSVTAGHAGASSTQTPYVPETVNDGNGATYSEAAAGGEGGPLEAQRWWIGDIGSAQEITHFVVKWVTNFGPDFDVALNEPTGIGSTYIRFQHSAGPTGPWTDIGVSLTDDDSHTPRTQTFTFAAPITDRYWRIFIGGKQFNNLWPGYALYTWGVWGVTEVENPASRGTARLQVASFNLDRSRKMAAAQLDVLLANELGLLSYYLADQRTAIPNNPIRAYAWYGPRANRVRVFTGILDRVAEHRNPKTVALKARSRMKWLLEQGFVASAPQGEDEDGAVRTEANGVYEDRSIEYIVDDILDRGGWPAADRVIATTGITLAEYVLADKSSWADQITGTDRLATAAGCDLWEDETGIIHFEPSPLISATEPTPAWEFAAGVNVLALDHDVDDDGLATRVAVSGPMTSTSPAWKQVWSTSKLDHPAGAWYDPTDPDYIRVVDRLTKKIYRMKQSDRTIASSKFLGGYPLGLSGIPGDSAHYLTLNAPWRNTGSTSGNSIRKYAKADNSLVATYSLPDGRWSAIKCDGSNIWLTNYDNGRLYKRTMTGGAVANYPISYHGVVQDQATGMWINGSSMGIFFAAHKRFLVVDTSDPTDVLSVQSTKGTRIAGGESDTDTDVDLYAVAGKGSFGLSSGMVAKFTLAELITNDVGATSIDYDLEDALGFQSGIADRDHEGCPNDPTPHPFESRLATFAMKVVQSLDQAQDVSDAQLALLKRLRRVLDLSTLGHPGIQLNDPISYADAPAGMVAAVWIIDSYRAQLSGAGTYTQTKSVLPWEAPP